jgi:outer membrane lipoprotein-sorting protein
VWILKPGKMRWDYYSKPKKTKVTLKKSFISDGKTLWVVEHDNKQIVKKSLEKDLMPVAISFLYGKGDLATDFDGVIDTKSKYGGKDDIVLALTPKKQSAQYKKLYLVVDPTDHRVKQSVIIDSADNVNNFRFFEPDFDKQVEDKWFQFDPNDKQVSTYRQVNADAADADADAGSGSGSGSAAGAGSAKTK